MLFKADDRGTGEDWAEVIACELAGLLGLPHVEYELAAEYDGGTFIRPGVVCENMAPRPASLVLGNQLLVAVDPDYPSQQRFRVRQHTVAAVVEILRNLHSPDGRWLKNCPAAIGTTAGFFVGYVMLDAWIANQDRHHENWGAIWDGRGDVRLAPRFDHGAALARNLLDSERHERLTTKDRNRTVFAFASRGRSAFYGSAADTKAMDLREAFLEFANHAPDDAKAWVARLRDVHPDVVRRIVEKVPAARMSAVARQFTMELLLTNQQRLVGTL